MTRRLKFPPENLMLRLFALILAFALWFLAAFRPSEVGVTTRIVTVPIALLNVGDGLDAAQSPGQARVVIEGPRLLLALGEDDVSAYIDLAQIGAGTHRLPVEVDTPSGLKMQRVEPAEVQIELVESEGAS